MVEKDSPGPSLELPSLFDRKKKRRSASSDDTTVTTAAPEAAPAPAPEPTPPPRTEPAPEPASAPGPVPAPAPAPAPSAETVVPAPSAETTDETRVIPPVRERETPRRTPDAPAGHPVAGPAEPGPDASTPLDEDRPRRGMPDLPDLGAAVAALVVGAVVGLLGVVLTFLGLQGCELVTGTDSCGGPGLLVLLAIVVAMVLAGAAMLRLFGVPDPGSVSFLGIGLLMVIVLVLLIDALASPTMLVVIPALTAGCFAAARWVTTQLSDDVMADR